MTKDQKPTVMIIEEDPGIREYYGLELEDHGYDVVTMGDVTAVKQAVSRSEPDLIILDPWIRGRYRWDVLSSVKRQDSQIPVLLCLDFDRHRKCAALVEGVFVKSSSTADLLLKVGQITGREGSTSNMWGQGTSETAEPKKRSEKYQG